MAVKSLARITEDQIGCAGSNESLRLGIPFIGEHTPGSFVLDFQHFHKNVFARLPLSIAMLLKEKEKQFRRLSFLHIIPTKR